MPELFHFLRPLWLLLIPVFLVLLWFWRKQNHNNAWNQVCDSHLLEHLLEGQQQKMTVWPALIIALAGILSLLALAGPTWSKRPQPVFQTEQAQVILFDLSHSMDATDVKPSRLAQARFKLLDLLAQSQEGQTGLLVFAGEAHTVSPLTGDTRTIASLVPALETALMPVQGGKLTLALEAGMNLLKQGGANRGRLLLITDSTPNAAALDKATALARAGYPVSVLAVGTGQGAPIPLAKGGFLKDKRGAIVLPKLNRNALQTLAANGHGLYVEMTADNRDLKHLNQTLDKDQFSRQQEREAALDSQGAQWEEQGPWLLLLVLPLLALGFRRGWLLSVTLVLWPASLLFSANDALALEWADLWQRPDQRGAKALQAEQEEQAASLFKSPQWQGVANYRAENYEAAEQAFAKVDTADAHYNRGNALAKQGKLEQAIEAYQMALEKQVDFSQAKDNLEQVKQALQQQKNQDNSQSRQDGENSQENQDSQQAQDGQQGQQQQGDKQQESSQSGAEQNEQQKGAENQQSAQAEQSGEQQEQATSSQNQSQEDSDKQDENATRQNQQTADNQENAAPQNAGQAGAETPQEEALEQVREALKQGQEEATEAAEQQQENIQANAQQQAQKTAENNQAQASPMQAELSPEQRQAQEQQIALEQWLKQVKDDPGGLLRRKFAVQSQQRQLQQQRFTTSSPTVDESEQAW